jgi:hypothetical protein
MGKIYRPKQPFSAPVDGVPWSFTRETLVEEGHPLLDVYEALFEEIEAHFKAPEPKKRSVESATAAPGEKRNK